MAYIYILFRFVGGYTFLMEEYLRFNCPGKTSHKKSLEFSIIISEPRESTNSVANSCKFKRS